MNHHTNKKTYQKPFMEVVELHQDLQMLTGSSGVTAQRSSYERVSTIILWDDSEAEGTLSDPEKEIYLWLLGVL